jgi:hypothetical protein
MTTQITIIRSQHDLPLEPELNFHKRIPQLSQINHGRQQTIPPETFPIQSSTKNNQNHHCHDRDIKYSGFDGFHHLTDIRLQLDERHLNLSRNENCPGESTSTSVYR